MEPLSITFKLLKIYMATKTKENNVLVIYNIDINMLQGRILNKDCTVSKGGIVLSNNRINTRMRL